MKQKKKIELINILNIATIISITYFIYKYIDLVNKNLIKKTNINIFIYILIANIIYFVIKRIRKEKWENEWRGLKKTHSKFTRKKRSNLIN